MWSISVAGTTSKITPMKQEVFTQGQVRLLPSKGHSCYRPWRIGERKPKSVSGCIVDAKLNVFNVVILKKRERDIPGLTHTMCLGVLDPKELAESTNFSISLKNLMSASML